MAVLALLGVAYAQTFASVQDAVAGLPELSMLNQNTNAIALADKLRDPNFVGTLFAPTNAALKPMEEAVGGDLTSLLGDPEQVNDVFSTAVIPTQVLTLADLKDGMSLPTLNGNIVKVTIKQTASGPAYYINKARITRGNIKAGKAIIHEMSSIVVPPEYQDMLDALVPADDSAPVATVDASGTGSATTTTSGATTTAGSTTNVKDAVASGTTTTTTTTTEPASRILAANATTGATATKSSGSSATMAAALLAVPALLAVLL
ncbi:hypothetical protein OEZ86_004885 [Tetradesmus obliquus]|nr:hypothetical protein OEZ86_004885 [Tetradesmus obliquus]